MGEGRGYVPEGATLIITIKSFQEEGLTLPRAVLFAIIMINSVIKRKFIVLFDLEQCKELSY